MSHKRPRAAFEADLRAQQSPYVAFGTPLPPLDPEVRDDGSYVPVWKQEVRDERGRKRLHGAFTGGWSAGYFNTVGSKEGWTPATFVSSRSNRRKDDATTTAAAENKPQQRKQQRPEDFMDEEDLADAAEAQKLQTAQGFAGLGAADEDGFTRRSGGLADIFRVQGETMGVKLLRKMGWKDGQGIGPKIRRKARLDVGDKQGASETHLFAPDNVPMISFVRKLDRKGLGYEGESRLAPLKSSAPVDGGENSSDEEIRDGPLIRPNATKKKPSKFAKGGIGIGILNDTGSDDEDPYEIGPRISYNRVIGGEKKKKKANTTTSVNPALRSAPVFKSRRSVLAQAGKNNLRKCHDGRLPLDGFVFGVETNDLASTINSEVNKYPPPKVPPDWKPSKQKQKAEEQNATSSNYLSTADAAKASKLDPKSRAALLGEAQLPGKSVFDFLSASARDRLAAATGKPDLPPALGEVPAAYALTDAQRQQELLRRVPELDKATAVAAIARGASGGVGAGGGPYADDEAKRGRYRAYLEYAAGFAGAKPPAQRPGVSTEDYLRELHEFYGCARIFKPMTGAMASRFTTSSSTSKFVGGTVSSDGSNNEQLLSRPAQKPADPAEEAARMGMYGSMTRSVADFYPTRLLCKRFNVRPPAHVQPDHPDGQADAKKSSGSGSSSSSNIYTTTTTTALASGSTGFGEGAMTLDELLRQAQTGDSSGPSAQKTLEAPPAPPKAGAVVNAEVNEALEGKRAQEDVLRAIFGDSSDEED